MNILIDFVIDQQISSQKALTTASLIAKHLGVEVHSQPEVYPKFENAYRFGLTTTPEMEINICSEAIILANKICSPWLTWYHHDEGRLEMIFNRNDLASFESEDYKVIRWGQIQTGI